MTDYSVSVNEYANEAYLQYEKLTGTTLPRKSDGSWDVSTGEFVDNDVDAFRHAYVMGKLVMSGVPSSVMKFIGIDHESVSSSQEAKDMDLWNNSIGIKFGGIASSSDDLANLVKSAIDNGNLVTSPKLLTDQQRS